MTQASAQRVKAPFTQAPTSRPKLGFVGTGWIGRLRMQALLQQDIAEFVAVQDPSPEAARAATELSPEATTSASFDDLLEQDLDGVVIATPSALHAEQCIQALERGLAVFCQKPLARTGAETQRVVEAARSADRLLQVDFSYRYLAGMESLRQKIAQGELGEIYAADLTFHNAYGPDKPWFYDVKSAGGGCVMDLGIHLVDLLMWLLGGDADSEQVHSSLYHQGRKLQAPINAVEDYATAEFRMGAVQSRLSCSWNLHAGQDAVITIELWGTQGGARISNVNGSFYDFEIHHFRGTSREKIAGYPDDWGGRALIAWANQLQLSNRFDPTVEQAVSVANLLDRIYQR